MEDSIKDTFKVVVLGEGKSNRNHRLNRRLVESGLLLFHLKYLSNFICDVTARVGKTSITIRFCVNKFND